MKPPPIRPSKLMQTGMEGAKGPQPHRVATSHQVGLGALGPFHPGWHEFAWTDGGGLFAGTALAVASWAVCFGPLDPRSGFGQVAGAQTSQRGELQAACVAAHRRVGRLTIVTDSRYVSDGLGRLTLRAAPPDGENADLWAALWIAGGGREVLSRWVPAHGEAPAPPLLSALDWAGNARADALASGALRAAAPPAALLTLQQGRRRDAAVVADLVGSVQAAVVSWNNQRLPGGAPRVPRRAARLWPTPQVLAAPDLGRQVGGAPVPPDLAVLPPLGVHDLRLVGGPPPGGKAELPALPAGGSSELLRAHGLCSLLSPSCFGGRGGGGGAGCVVAAGYASGGDA